MPTQPTYENHFEGAWLVSEYVYSPSGEFVGVVRQTRRVEAMDSGTVRVTQNCAPESSLAENPMAAFEGEHVFDLRPDGNARRYLGPAVIGRGLTWGDGAMTGRGLWPEFGHNFTSFAVMSQPEVQLTGGKFLTATEMVANIVGIAMPQTSAEPVWPEFGGPMVPSEVSSNWKGTLRQVAADGSVIKEASLARSYVADGAGVMAVESVDGVANLRLATTGTDRLEVSGRCEDLPFVGLGKTFGWLTELELCLQPDRIIEWMEVLDAERGRLVGIRRWWTDAVMDRVDVVNLCAYDK